MTPDREALIHAIELRENIAKKDHHGFVDFPYEMVGNVLALLKEQEAVEPYQHDAVWLCGNCEKEVVGWDDDIDGKENRYPYCRQCGRSVKWE